MQTDIRELQRLADTVPELELVLTRGAETRARIEASHIRRETVWVTMRDSEQGHHRLLADCDLLPDGGQRMARRARLAGVRGRFDRNTNRGGEPASPVPA